MRGLLNSLADFPEFIDATSESNLHRSHNLVTPPPSFPFLIAQIAQSRPVLVISGSSRGAEDIASELRDLHDRVLEFPAWETLPHERLSPRSDTVARRIQTLNELAHSNSALNPIVITPVRGVIHRIIADLAKQPLLAIEQGQEISLSELIRHLTDLAYVRTDLVEKRGEFAVRGGIIDLFLPLTKHPVRIDFFGDEIEELNYFEVSGQRTSEPVIGKLEIFPCRELLLTEEIQVKANDLISKFPAAAEMLDRMAAGIATEGMESLIPLLIEEQETLLDRMPANTEIIFLDEERIRSRAADLLSTNDEFLAASWSNAAVGAVAPVHTGVSTYLAWDELAEKIISLGLNRRSLNSFGSDLSENTDFMAISAIDPLRGDLDQLLAVLGEAVLNNFKVIFTANGHGMVERYAGIFRGADLPVYVVDQLQAKPTAGLIHITTTPITYGFSYPSAQILFITEHDLTGSKSRVKDSDRLPSKRKQSVDPLELKAGDFVVHEQHGIGRYVEMIQRETAGVVREYLIIEYASAKRGQPGDRIFVPTDSLEQVSKYIGGESPTVHRIGSGEWQKAKGRARKAVRQIAGELIRLYAARTSAPGFAFSPDTPWQRELEDAFSYIETLDQLATIDEVKRDMERPFPMDRIICGDVGYGKTEIAIRAAFKAVQDGKQVAVLVPTTLLVQQHYKTFTERYSGFPIKVAGMSRFNTAKESKEITLGLGEGAIDVVIGTHRILSNDVIFKDLGLVIVDEEQRFGVEQKESLKKLRTTVDVLSMSATPIPRTLEMAVTGIREMSTITTPPEERHPILTYVGASEDAQIAAAIHRELLRDGQIFYIHNRVNQLIARLRVCKS